jgi:hypothetical protein
VCHEYSERILDYTVRICRRLKTTERITLDVFAESLCSLVHIGKTEWRKILCLWQATIHIFPMQDTAFLWLKTSNFEPHRVGTETLRDESLREA